MPTALEKGYVFAQLDELEGAPLLAPGATDDGRQRFDVRRRLEITSFGIQAFRAPSGVDLNGAATFEVDGESIDAPAGSLVHVQPTSKRKATSKEDGTTIMVVGGTPGKPYEPAPEEAREAFAAYSEGDYDTAIVKQRIVVEKRPNDPVSHFNAACFAARAGRADEAIDHLRDAVAINDRVKELMATDEDLDSIREDVRFAEIAR